MVEVVGVVRVYLTANSTRAELARLSFARIG